MQYSISQTTLSLWDCQHAVYILYLAVFDRVVCMNFLLRCLVDRSLPIHCVLSINQLSTTVKTCSHVYRKTTATVTPPPSNSWNTTVPPPSHHRPTTVPPRPTIVPLSTTCTLVYTWRQQYHMINACSLARQETDPQRDLHPWRHENGIQGWSLGILCTECVGYPALDACSLTYVVLTGAYHVHISC